MFGENSEVDGSRIRLSTVQVAVSTSIISRSSEKTVGVRLTQIRNIFRKNRSRTCDLVCRARTLGLCVRTHVLSVAYSNSSGSPATYSATS